MLAILEHGSSKKDKRLVDPQGAEIGVGLEARDRTYLAIFSPSDVIIVHKDNISQILVRVGADED